VCEVLETNVLEMRENLLYVALSDFIHKHAVLLECLYYRFQGNKIVAIASTCPSGYPESIYLFEYSHISHPDMLVTMPTSAYLR
jgi:hypothetical protein